MADTVLTIKPKVWRVVVIDVLVLGLGMGVVGAIVQLGETKRVVWATMGEVLEIGMWATLFAFGFGLLLAFGWAETRRRVGTIVVTETDIVGPNGGWVWTDRSRIPCAELRSVPLLIRDRWDRLLRQSRITTLRGDRSIVILDGYYDQTDLAALMEWLARHAGPYPKAA